VTPLPTSAIWGSSTSDSGRRSRTPGDMAAPNLRRRPVRPPRRSSRIRGSAHTSTETCRRPPVASDLTRQLLGRHVAGGESTRNFAQLTPLATLTRWRPSVTVVVGLDRRQGRSEWDDVEGRDRVTLLVFVGSEQGSGDERLGGSRDRQCHRSQEEGDRVVVRATRRRGTRESISFE